MIPQYREVFDICANRAAVRFKDGRTGVVDESGVPMVVTKTVFVFMVST